MLQSSKKCQNKDKNVKTKALDVVQMAVQTLKNNKGTI